MIVLRYKKNHLLQTFLRLRKADTQRNMNNVPKLKEIFWNDFELYLLQLNENESFYCLS